MLFRTTRGFDPGSSIHITPRGKAVCPIATWWFRVVRYIARVYDLLSVQAWPHYVSRQNSAMLPAVLHLARADKTQSGMN